MYCPRCGAPNTDTTKFCRQCGLALLEVTNYVATGGTSPLLPAPPAAQVAASFSPKQKMWLAILSFILLPAIAGIVGDAIGDRDFINLILPLSAIMMPIGITISVMYFRNQAKLMKQAQASPPYHAPQHAYAPPQPQAYLQASVVPVNAVPASDVPRQTPNTNPLAHQPVSIIEDETKRLPNQ